VKTPHPGHDIVVVGASAGGVEALRQLVSALPSDFPGAVFVVLHIPAHAPSALPAILDRAGPLPAVAAADQLPIERGHIYVAPPNRHLLLHHGHMALQAGPRENSARPSADVLFRSAARAYGPRVVGVVLSGTLQDGALGLAAIKMRGGITIVQDPDDALFPGMPRSALTTAPIDYQLRVQDIPSRLVELTAHTLTPVESVVMDESNAEPTEQTMYAADEPDGVGSPKLHNAASGITCPECHGSLWELREPDSLRFECRVGHAYSLDALVAEQGEAVEAALWSAVNALKERAAVLRRLRPTDSPNGSLHEERAELTERHADALLELLRRLIAEEAWG
jgi:two-component system chemotaxis response regulator CheB